MPTAQALSREEWKSYVEAARHRVVSLELAPDDRQRREQVLRRVREAANMLKARFDVCRVVLFGSLAHAAWFRPDSDVDLAVEGLSGKDYWAAWRLVEDLVGDRSVDLVDLETAGESLRRAIARHGIDL